MYVMVLTVMNSWGLCFGLDVFFQVQSFICQSEIVCKTETVCKTGYSASDLKTLPLKVFENFCVK